MPAYKPFFEPRPFNSPLEAGIRALTLMVEGYPAAFDLQRLLYLDYLLVHSGDIDGGPPSLHPPIPERSGELLVRRELIEKGLLLLLSRGLSQRLFNTNGITYMATEEAAPLLDNIAADYMQGLRARAAWALSNFQNYTDTQLERFFKENLDRWEGEFEQDIDMKEAYQW